jgi:phosphonate degradation associated HDIG domain protein
MRTIQFIMARDIISDVFQVFKDHGHKMYGEAVTELQHALQCATFAERAGESPQIIAACLLHDYGHLCHNMGEDIAARGVDVLHEELGAYQLAGLFTVEVVEPVRLHVAAKRYLCWREPNYLPGLSEASRHSLYLQGGRMTDIEAAEFEDHQFYEAAVLCRRYDDKGKVIGMPTPDLEHFRRYLEPFVRPES